MTMLDHFGADISARPKAAAPNRLKLLSATAACAVTMALTCFAGSAMAESSEEVLYNFKTTKNQIVSDAQWPFGGLLPGPNGSFYGTTTYGGDLSCGFGCGTIFQMIPPAQKSGEWTRITIKALKNAEGSYPKGSLISDSKGNLYGVTGTDVYMLSPPSGASLSWTYTILHPFRYTLQGDHGPGDGQGPADGLVMDEKGNLFGTTMSGGRSFDKKCNERGCGIAYELSPPSGGKGPWTETILHSFQGGGEDGEFPSGALIEKNGILYGTTVGGGLEKIGCLPGSGDDDYTCGTVFSLARDSKGGWSETILHKFLGRENDGYNPTGALYMDKAGNLFGTTAAGGNGTHCGTPLGYTGCGTVFELSPPDKGSGAWTESVIHNFIFSDGDAPVSALIANEKGELFGTAMWGGLSGQCGDDGESTGCGTVFKLSPPSQQGKAWAETTLYEFTGANRDGGNPMGKLVFGTDGSLYGTTVYSDNTYHPCVDTGGAFFIGCGTVFEVNPK